MSNYFTCTAGLRKNSAAILSDYLSSQAASCILKRREVCLSLHLDADDDDEVTETRYFFPHIIFFTNFFLNSSAGSEEAEAPPRQRILGFWSVQLQGPLHPPAPFQPSSSVQFAFS